MNSPPCEVVIGQIAQLVEQRTENPRVGGSTPSLATIKINKLRLSEKAASFLAQKGVDGFKMYE